MKYLLGLIGHPVSQSMSPPLHKAALLYFGMDGDYKLFDVEPNVLPQKLALLKSDGLLGFNITIPHKIAVYNLCQELTPEAQIVGAANTVLFDDNGAMTGHNTDFVGLHGALLNVIDARRDTACILGAGGAAKAAIRVFEKLGFRKIVVFARDVEKAAQTLGLAYDGAVAHSAFSAQIVLKATDLSSGEDCLELFKGVSLIVNCLPIGQTLGEVPEWLRDLLTKQILQDTYIYDMVYSKSQNDTPLVAFSKAIGFHSSDGMSMLVNQAMYAFSFWTGQLPPYDVMESAFLTARAQGSHKS